MLKRALFVSSLIIWLSLTCFAQDSSSGKPATVHSQLRGRKCKILLFNGRRLTTRSLDSLSGNTLYISDRKGPQTVSLDLVKELRIAKGKRATLRGTAFGALGGAILGAILGGATYRKPDPGGIDFGSGASIASGAIAGLLVGGITGTIIGVSSRRYNRYNFSIGKPGDKIELMTRILSG